MKTTEKSPIITKMLDDFFGGIKPSETFRIKLRISLEETERERMNHVLNRLHTGKSEVDPDIGMTEKHRLAAHKLNQDRDVTIDIKIDINGNWSLVEIEMSR